MSELQQQIKSVRAERGFTTDPVQLLCLLVEEVGEVASEIKKTWSPNYAELSKQDLENELADAFVLLSALGSSFEIDLETAVTNKFFAADAERVWATSTVEASSDE